MNGFRKGAVVGLALAVLSSWVPERLPALGGAGSEGGTSADGTIDLETADRLVGEYARHVLSRLPRDWRRQEEKRWRDHPPGLGPHLIYQLHGPDGHIALEHDPDTRRLLAWALIHKMRREIPPIGLTREEILTALERAAAAGVDTGGGEVVYDSEADGFFLRRPYHQPPKSFRQMARELDRLTTAGERWLRKHYLDAVLSHARTLRPPPGATARDGDFEVTLLLTPDVRYHELWHRPPGAVQPQIVSRSEYRRGQEVWALGLFSGATAGQHGAARLDAQYSFVYPDGEEAGSEVFRLWDGPPPPEGHLQLVEKRAAIELGADKLLGAYLARLKVCDVLTGRCITAESPFRVRPETPPRWPLTCSAFPPGGEALTGCARRDPDGEIVLRPGALADIGAVDDGTVDDGTGGDDEMDAAEATGIQAVLVEGELLFALASGKTAPALLYDNGPDTFVEGRARTIRDGKVGFVDESLELAVPRDWDFAFPFENGVARVCTGCSLRRAEGDEHSEVTGGRWGYVDRDGRIVVPVEHARDELPAP